MSTRFNCHQCFEELPLAATFCSECGAEVDAAKATTVWSKDDAQQVSNDVVQRAGPSTVEMLAAVMPGSRARRRLFIAAGLALLVGIGIVAFGGKDDAGSTAKATAAKSAPEQPKEVLLVPETGPRKDIKAPAMKAVAASSLGMPFDENFKPLRGPRVTSMFPEGQVSSSVENRYTHDISEIDTMTKLRAQIGLLGLMGAEVGHETDSRYLTVRAMHIVKSHRLDDSGGMRQPPAGAAYYLAEIHEGAAVNMVYRGDEWALTAGAYGIFKGVTGDLDTELSERKIEFKAQLVGVTGNKQAIFETSPEAVLENYVEEPASYSTVELVFRQIPGTETKGREIPWRRLALDEKATIRYSQEHEWALRPGRYRVRIESKGLRMSVRFGGAKSGRHYPCAVPPVKGSAETKCRFGRNAKIEVSNPHQRAFLGSAREGNTTVRVQAWTL